MHLRTLTPQLQPTLTSIPKATLGLSRKRTHSAGRDDRCDQRHRTRRGHSKRPLDPFAGTSARGISLCLDSEMNSRQKSHDFASSAHWVTGTGDDPKPTMSYRDRSLPSRTVGHRERSLLNSQIGQSGTQMPQIAHWVIGAVVCSTRELGHWNRSLPNSTLGHRERELPNRTVGQTDRSLPERDCA